MWLHIDDIERLNAALSPFGLSPNRDPVEARQTGRYALENGEHIDVIVARRLSTITGGSVDFDGVWERREQVSFGPAAQIAIPCLDDLIATKRIAARPKDVEDIRLLEALRTRGAR